MRVGVSMTLLGYLVLLVCVDFLGQNASMVNAIRSVLIAQLSFFGHRLSTWKDRRDQSVLLQWLTFMALWLPTTSVNQALFNLLVHGPMAFGPKTAYVVSASAMGVITFLLNNRLTFGRLSGEVQNSPANVAARPQLATTNAPG